MPCGAVGGRSALTNAKCERALNCAVALLCQSSINTGLVQSIAGRSLLPSPALLRFTALLRSPALAVELLEEPHHHGGTHYERCDFHVPSPAGGAGVARCEYWR